MKLGAGKHGPGAMRARERRAQAGHRLGTGWHRACEHNTYWALRLQVTHFTLNHSNALVAGVNEPDRRYQVISQLVCPQVP